MIVRFNSLSPTRVRLRYPANRNVAFPLNQYTKTTYIDCASAVC